MSKVEKIYHNYYKEIPQDTFRQIISADPTSIKKDELVVKLGKYSQWLLKIYKENNLLLEDLYKANEYLSSFHALKEKHLIPFDKRDILKYESLPQIFEVNQKIGGIGKVDNKENFLITDRLYINKKEASIFYEDDDWFIVIPKTFKASSFYAKKSQWCTQYPDMYRHYTKTGTLYILHDKKKIGTTRPTRRMQFHFESQQFMNLYDVHVSMKLFFKRNPAVYNVFSNLFKKQLEDLMKSVMNKRHVINTSHATRAIKLLPVLTNEETKNFYLQLYHNNKLQTYIAHLKCYMSKSDGKALLGEMLNNDNFKNTTKLSIDIFIHDFVLPFGTTKQIGYVFENLDLRLNRDIFNNVCQNLYTDCFSWMVKNHFNKIKHFITPDFFRGSCPFTYKKLVANTFYETYPKEFFDLINSSAEFLTKENLKKCAVYVVKRNVITHNRAILKAMPSASANEYFENIFPRVTNSVFLPLSKLNKKNLRIFWIKTLKNYERYNYIINGYHTRSMPDDLRRLYIHLLFLKIRLYKYPISLLSTPFQRDVAKKNKFIKFKKMPNGLIKRITKPLNKKEIAILDKAKNIRAKKVKKL